MAIYSTSEPANELDVVGSSGQIITVPQGKYSHLGLLASGINGNQQAVTFSVNYTDGTASTFTQNFSDWYTPQQFSREFEAVAMAYRNFDDGTKDQRIFNLYAYPFTLNSAKTVKSITLPNNPDVVVLAATLVK